MVEETLHLMPGARERENAIPFKGISPKTLTL
jgi:hypothetical protein